MSSLPFLSSQSIIFYYFIQFINDMKIHDLEISKKSLFEQGNDIVFDLMNEQEKTKRYSILCVETCTF